MLKILPRFQALLPALEANEIAALRGSLLADGCRDPLVTWHGFLVDGHHRYALCEELSLPYETRELEAADEDEVEDWIDQNQLARRNLSPEQFRLALGRRYNRQKRQGERTDLTSGKIFQKLDLQPTTAETLAKEHGVSERTVRTAGQLAAAVEQVIKEEPEVAAEGQAAIIERAKAHVKERNPHVAHNSGDNEWYTSKPFIEAARQVMEEITLDPASTEIANTIVEAQQIYTAEENGLQQDWTTRLLWMTPPFESGLIGKFIEKLATAVELGQVGEALILVNNATETQWFARLASVASYLCFPTGRVKFWHLLHKGHLLHKESTPLQGQALAYIGPNGKIFATHFKKFGIIVQIEQHGDA